MTINSDATEIDKIKINAVFCNVFNILENSLYYKYKKTPEKFQ